MSKLDKILTAIARNQVAKFKKLVTADIVDTVDEDGYTLLANVVLDEDADAEMARHLIKLGAAINRVGAPDEKWVALALALRDGRTEIAKMLLDAGANTIAKDSSGNTPLHYAMHPLGYDHIPQEPILELVTVLLANGADPRQKNRVGESPLSMAKLGELHDVLKMFKQTNNRSAAKPAEKKRAAAKSRSKDKKSATRAAKATKKRAKRKST
jgi:ankyrin repeat protein